MLPVIWKAPKNTEGPGHYAPAEVEEETRGKKEAGRNRKISGRRGNEGLERKLKHAKEQEYYEFRVMEEEKRGKRGRERQEN